MNELSKTIPDARRIDRRVTELQDFLEPQIVHVGGQPMIRSRMNPETLYALGSDQRAVYDAALRECERRLDAAIDAPGATLASAVLDHLDWLRAEHLHLRARSQEPRT